MGYRLQSFGFSGFWGSSFFCARPLPSGRKSGIYSTGIWDPQERSFPPLLGAEAALVKDFVKMTNLTSAACVTMRLGPSALNPKPETGVGGGGVAGGVVGGVGGGGGGGGP